MHRRMKKEADEMKMTMFVVKAYIQTKEGKRKEEEIPIVMCQMLLAYKWVPIESMLVDV